MKVLLIEPDKVLRQIYIQAFEDQNIIVSACASSQEAVTILEDFFADVIVTELQIAEHNGVELIHEIRSYLEWQDIPIVINSIIPHSNVAINNAVMKQLNITDYMYKAVTSLQKLISVTEQACYEKA